MTTPTKKISELFSNIKIGGTPSRGNPSFFGGGNLWVSIKDMEGQSLITKTAETITDQGARHSNCKLIKQGSLLFSFKLTVGRVSFAGADLYTNEAIAAFDLDEAELAGIDLEYLSLVLPIAASGDTTKNSMGAALLNKDKIHNLKIPFPDVIEQRQIAARLKEQLSEVESARQAAHQQLSDSRLLRTRMLKSFFTELDATPKKKIGDHAPTTSGSTPSRSNKQYWQPPEVAWVKTGEVAFASITTTKESISSKALVECSLNLLPPKTILIAMYGQGKTRGQSAILEIPATTNQACFAILPNDTWEPDFLYLWLKASYQDLRDLSEDRGGNQANLNGALLKALEVPAPSKTIQQQIVKRIQAAMTEIDVIEGLSQAILSDIDRLPSQILAQAFENSQ
tara:strand:+ start:6815 stop:8005 length:1191 start_codon:yes stop_codon:yes gene_type:complete